MCTTHKKGGFRPRLLDTCTDDLERHGKLYAIGSWVIPVPSRRNTTNGLVVKLSLIGQVFPINGNAVSVVGEHVAQLCTEVIDAAH